MNDTIKFLTRIKNDSKESKVVTDALNKLGYQDDDSKRVFLDKLQHRRLIDHKIVGSSGAKDVYTRNAFNEKVGLNPDAKPFEFSAKITESGQVYLNEFLSKEESKRHNTITRWIAGIAALLTLCSLLWNIYQGSQVVDLKNSLQRANDEIRKLQIKAIQLDSILEATPNQHTKSIMFQNPDVKVSKPRQQTKSSQSHKISSSL